MMRLDALPGIGTLRLFRIEVRRSVGLWCFPLLVGLAWWAGRELSEEVVTLWSQISERVVTTSIFVAPAVAGIAAWAAGRDRRRGIEDLLETTAKPAAGRELAAWAGLVVWGVAAFLVAGAYFSAEGWREATWGGPWLGPIAAAVASIVAGAALGHAAGSFVPSRFTAPLVAVGLYAAQFGGLLWEQPRTGVRLLFPWALVGNVDYSVFVEPSDEFVPYLAAWLLGLAGIALTLAAMRHGRTPVLIGALGASLVVAGVSGVSLRGMEAQGESWMRPVDRAFVPECVERVIPVCVHPAFTAVLDESADTVSALIAPVAGLPGVPVRAEQRGIFSEITSEGTWVIYPSILVGESVGILVMQSLDFLRDPASIETLPTEREVGAQHMVAVWLVQQAGKDATASDLPWIWGPDGMSMALQARQAEIDAATARFAGLEPAARRAWLEANWTDLRAGRLTLADLP